MIATALPRDAEELDRPAVRSVQALEHLDGRGLSGAVRAEQSETFAARDFEIDRVDCRLFAVALDERIGSELRGSLMDSIVQL